jgi:predicted alpha/beta superfamily hydrolase
MLPLVVFLCVFWHMPAYAQRSALQESVTPITIGTSYTFPSAILAELRTINVYLPPGYTPSDTVRYPVIYLLDGGLDEDFIHIAGLVQFSSFEWVGRLQPSIVVGIANTDRKRDMTYPSSQRSDRELCPTSGGSARFMDFIEKELMPYVGAKFKTSGASTLIGESLGGLLASEVLLTRPQLFDRYIIISPSLWWDSGSLLDRSTTIKGAHQVYIAVGNEGLAPSSQPHVMEVDAHVLEEKLKAMHNPGLRVYLDYLPAETHATIAHQAALNAFRWLGQEKLH